MMGHDNNMQLYNRQNYTTAEKLYESYIAMRKIINELENLKYEKKDPYINSSEFKDGFIAGIKTLLAVIDDK